MKAYMKDCEGHLGSSSQVSTANATTWFQVKDAQVAIQHLKHLTLAMDSPAEVKRAASCGSSCPNFPETIGAGLMAGDGWKMLEPEAPRETEGASDGWSQYAGDKADHDEDQCMRWSERG